MGRTSAPRWRAATAVAFGVASAATVTIDDHASDVPREEREARDRIAALPPALAGVLRAILPSVADEILVAIRAEVDEYRRPFEGDFGQAVRRGVELSLGEFVAMLEDPAHPQAGNAVIEQLGRGEVRAGRTLDALQAAYRCGARVAWRRFGDAAREHGADQATLIRLGDAIFAYIHRLAALSVAGWAHEQSLQAGARQQARDALVAVVTSRGPVVPEQLDAAARALSWTPPGAVAVVIVPDSTRLGDLLLVDPLVVGAVREQVVIGILPAPSVVGRAVDALADVGAVLGPAVPWADVARSYRRARAVLDLQDQGRLPVLARGVVRADDHRASVIVHADPEAADDLAATMLEPFDRLPPGRRSRHLQTMRAWLDHRGSGPRMAEALHLHQQTVRYRIARLRELLDSDLEDAEERFRLDLALRRRGLRDPPAAGDAPGRPGPSTHDRLQP